MTIDPPRKGCDEKLLETVVKMAPSRIVYVSCDPGTLARDVKVLVERGYEVKRVRACDMFGGVFMWRRWLDYNAKVCRNL